MTPNLEVLNSFVDSIAVLDDSGKIIFTNKSWNEFCIRNSGIIENAGSGTNYLRQCNTAKGNDRETALQAAKGIKEIQEGLRDIFELEYPCHSPTEERWFLMRVTKLGVLPGYILISHINITRRKLAEEHVAEVNTHLKMINRRMEATVYKIVHDTIGPLNSLGWLVEMTRQEKDATNVGRYLEQVGKSLGNLKDYVQQTLSLVSLAPQKDEIDFSSLVQKFLESINYFENNDGIRIESAITQESTFISDRSEIFTILSNLISNSIKYADPAKKNSFIKVSGKVNANWAVISVEDNGIGLKDEDLDKIFNKRYQVNKGDGAGVGLFLVKKTVEFLNGEISVESKIGIGTKFVITLPGKKIQDELK